MYLCWKYVRISNWYSVRGLVITRRVVPASATVHQEQVFWFHFPLNTHHICLFSLFYIHIFILYNFKFNIICGISTHFWQIFYHQFEIEINHVPPFSMVYSCALWTIYKYWSQPPFSLLIFNHYFLDFQTRNNLL